MKRLVKWYVLHSKPQNACSATPAVTAGILNPAGPEMGSGITNTMSVILIPIPNSHHPRPYAMDSPSMDSMDSSQAFPIPQGPRTSKRSRAWSTAPSSSVCCWMQLGIALVVGELGKPEITKFKWRKWVFRGFPREKCYDAMNIEYWRWYLYWPCMRPQDVQKLLI